MLNIFARASVSRVTDPVGAWLVRAGLTPNAMTVIGATATCVAALWFFPRNQLVVGSLVVAALLLSDLLDGAMARTSGSVTRFGAVLDASCDRIADGVLFGSVVWWCFVVAGDRITGAAALICLGAAQVISYVKARAEATGLNAGGGLVERAERFIITLLGTLLQGLGVPHALSVALWLLVALALFTVGQRLVAVWRSARALDRESARGKTT
ncbi:MAG TPA: CDP-alcohol phosphatidyltransferase family protein [Pseudonocardiaceae bacterium]|jgi:CDP-diacylglycerol--glycerol-3-phosphate 3-phosphatidyltransferase|nr:CDP-alcohol phosphatidyltransferase family protein [Pseudonocardiaceae bacterium]